MRIDLGRIDGHEVALVGAGIGKVNTALVTTLLADRFGCRLVVFSGVAGGLDPGLRIGDVVIADRTLQHDAGVIEDGRLAHLPGWPRAVLQPDRPAGLSGRAGAARADPGATGRLRPAAPVPRRGWCRRAAADRVRHHPVRRPVHPLRGHARAAVRRARRGGGGDGRWRPWARSPRRSRSRGSTSARCPISPGATRASISPRSSHEVAGSSALHPAPPATGAMSPASCPRLVRRGALCGLGLLRPHAPRGRRPRSRPGGPG